MSRPACPIWPAGAVTVFADTLRREAARSIACSLDGLLIAASSCSTICLAVSASRRRFCVVSGGRPGSALAHDERSARSRKSESIRCVYLAVVWRGGVAEQLADLHQGGAVAGERARSRMPEVVDAHVFAADEFPRAQPGLPAVLIFGPRQIQQRLGNRQRLGLQWDDVQLSLFGRRCRL